MDSLIYNPEADGQSVFEHTDRVVQSLVVSLYRRLHGLPVTLEYVAKRLDWSPSKLAGLLNRVNLEISFLEFVQLVVVLDQIEGVETTWFSPPDGPKAA